MRSFLLQPYPFSDNTRNKLLVCGGVGLFILLFLGIFEPFGFDDLTSLEKWQHALAFGAVTFFISSFMQIGVPKLLPSLFREEAWRSWKEILFLLLTTIFIGAGNYGLMLLLYPQETNLAGLFRAQLITLQVGVIPVVFIVFMKQLTLYRRYATEAKKANSDIYPTVAEKTLVPAQPQFRKLELRGDNQKETLFVGSEDLFFISSADNYTKLFFAENGQMKQVIFRSSLKKLENQLSAFPQFFRCHRMFLVNLQLVNEVSGNAQGLKLHFSGLEETIPVSRSLTATVRERLHHLSHSPQND